MSESPTISTDSAAIPEWWGDVQQDRDDLGARSIDTWLDEEIDFLPRPNGKRRRSGRFDREQSQRRSVEREAGGEAAAQRRASRSPSEARVLDALDDLGDDLALDFSAESAARRRGRTGSFDVVIGEDGTLTALPEESLLADARFSSEQVLSAPPVAERPTVRITGHPDRPARQRERSLLDIIGPHPDRIAFWVVALGALLIVLSMVSPGG